PQGLLGRFRTRRSPALARVPQDVRELRGQLKIGMPRVLNMYTLAPLFRAYFEALGVSFRNIIWSDYTDPTMWYRGSRRGSIDQCFPSKVAIAHVHNLIFDKKERETPDIIFFPIIQRLPTELVNTVNSHACPVVAATPEVVKAAFTKEGDVFAERGIKYLAPSLDLGTWSYLEAQMYECFRDILKITPQENKEALDIAREAGRKYLDSLRSEARQVLDRLEAEGRVGVVMLGRPYHSDPGLNHSIMEEMQKKGYPVFSIESLPQDPDILERLFGQEMAEGDITHAMDISDVWKNSYSENTNKKTWAAKYVARHPNLVAIDLSSFKCGHDAPIYNTVERIIETSGTPYFTFHDIDENKPAASIKIRVETIDYFLQRYQEHLQRQAHAEKELAHQVGAYRSHLVRANLRAAQKLETAGTVPTGGNGSMRVGSNSHRPGPVGDLNTSPNSSDGSRPLVLAQSDLNGAGGGRAAGANGLDSGTYDRLRAQNTVNDAPEGMVASPSAGCGLPWRDAGKAHPTAAGAAGGPRSSHGGTPPGAQLSAASFIQLVNLRLPHRERVEDEPDAIPSAGHRHD
ncbi:MAG TPA: acyl-CoA dehydratase activase-related protein, partial [Dehalococcoidia bacterium]|nr:acyl-CoA dehydratase activase-related protein [Dehalococcoidia bacterium]